jgi:DNA-binding MarR family transcriptional regulator/N-acetylglutamate synthase-like GNAT family acetyltransferase
MPTTIDKRVGGAKESEPVARVRSFNRFYTNLLGVLQEGFLRTPYSLAESRVIFELAHRRTAQLTELRRDLDLDAGYMTRILTRLEADGLVSRERSEADARRQVVRLSRQGQRTFQTLDKRSTQDVAMILSRLSGEEQYRLLASMATIQKLLAGAQAAEVALRQLAAGDFGWVIERHGVLYAEEYGWDHGFEALVARIVAGYIEHHDPSRENAWIADVDGERAGCVVCTEKERDVAQLRLLLVEPWARSCGVGTRLVDACLTFAKRAGYGRIMLWTNDVLVDARRIYERAGFALADEEKHHSFGRDLVGQNWEKSLEP